jgi:hypothetical protein
MPIFIGRGAPVYRGTLAYPDLRQGSRSHPAPLFAALVTGKWNMALKVHSVVEDAHDFDRALWRGPAHQEVTSATTVFSFSKLTSAIFALLEAFSSSHTNKP